MSDFSNFPDNPVRVTEEASTFTESDVTVTHNNTEVPGGAIQFDSPLVDDFESGDLTVEDQNFNDWGGDVANFQAQSNTVLSGSFSGKLSASDATNRVDLDRVNSKKISRVALKVRIDNRPSSQFDNTRILLEDQSATNPVAVFGFESSGVEVNFSSTSTSWSVNKNYQVEFSNIDYSAETFDCSLNGTTVVSNEPFQNSASGLDQISFRVSTSSSGETTNSYIDDVEAGERLTSGDALVSFDNGSPTDIDSYDLATFQRTLDGETVTIDVEDSNGNVLKSDIDKNTDISSIATSKDVQLRANLSRNDTANNPTVDYLARRFTR